MPNKLGICIRYLGMISSCLINSVQAVCVLCQYQIENGSELFDALVEDVLRESDDELDDDESDDESDDEYDDETDLRIAF